MDLDDNKLPAEIKERIQSIVTKERYEDYKVMCKNLSISGGSFVGDLYEIDIIGNTGAGKRELHLFLKSKVDNEHMKIYSVTDCFVRESFFYNELSKIFAELQDEAAIPADDRFQIPKSYDETDASLLILENLSRRDFKVYPKMEDISLDYAELSIKELARFHALSFVLEKKKPEYFNEKIRPMNPLFNFGEDWRGFIRNMFNYSINCLEPNVKNRVEETISKKIYDYEKYMCDTSGVRTLCHGDYKHNNVMAKEMDGKATEVVTVDYQLLHYGCPILDFLYFIFNGTSQDFRRQHLSTLKNLYYDTMRTFLQHFLIDIETVYKRTDFEKDYKEKLDFGLIFNIFFVPFLFAAEEEVSDITDKPLSNLSFNVDARFTERFRGVVDDFIQWGYI